MKKTELIMGMPITVEIVGSASSKYFDLIFDYFRKVDNRFSTYKSSSEISKINRGLPDSEWSNETKSVLALCQQTNKETSGYFDISHEGKIDPSGLVKGWSIANAAKLLLDEKVNNF